MLHLTQRNYLPRHHGNSLFETTLLLPLACVTELLFHRDAFLEDNLHQEQRCHFAIYQQVKHLPSNEYIQHYLRVELYQLQRKELERTPPSPNHLVLQFLSVQEQELIAGDVQKFPLQNAYGT